MFFTGLKRQTGLIAMPVACRYHMFGFGFYVNNLRGYYEESYFGWIGCVVSV